jgi:hypothetical protein
MSNIFYMEYAYVQPLLPGKVPLRCAHRRPRRIRALPALHSPAAAAALNAIVTAVTILIVANIVLQSVIAALTRNRLTDERDRLIRLRGYRAGYFTVVGLMLLGMAMLWVHTSLGQMQPSHLALHFLSVFYAILILAEVVKTVTQLVAYRRAI